MALNPNPRPSLTPPTVDWLVWQLSEQCLPALEVHFRLMRRYQAKIETMLNETSWNATQRAEATAILDQLARFGVIYAGAEEHPQERDRDGKFTGDDDEQITSTG